MRVYAYGCVYLQMHTPVGIAMQGDWCVHTYVKLGESPRMYPGIYVRVYRLVCACTRATRCVRVDIHLYVPRRVGRCVYAPGGRVYLCVCTPGGRRIPTGWSVHAHV